MLTQKQFSAGLGYNFKDRFLLGVGDTYKTVNATGGEATHKLTIDEMPSHHHRFVAPAGERPYLGALGSSGDSYSLGDREPYPGTNTMSLSFTGGDKAHNNLPPYLTVYMWKRTA